MKKIIIKSVKLIFLMCVCLLSLSSCSSLKFNKAYNFLKKQGYVDPSKLELGSNIEVFILYEDNISIQKVDYVGVMQHIYTISWEKDYSDATYCIRPISGYSPTAKIMYFNDPIETYIKNDGSIKSLSITKNEMNLSSSELKDVYWKIQYALYTFNSYLEVYGKEFL